jgi:23S rRNA pseudouridine1911/1915/1917 synthase
MPSFGFIVDRREAGHTLASVLKTRYGLTWSKAKRLVEGRHVKVSGQVETDIARRLKAGKKVEVATGTVERKTDAQNRTSEAKPLKTSTSQAASKLNKPTTKPKAEPLPVGIEIVYSDEDVVVAAKPAGLTTMRHWDEAAEFGEGKKKYLPRTLADVLPAASLAW